ncbi:MAG: TolC family protein [Planctomycetes bacterium]|nr:TolC family protein [Planctomycetota bacterium]
MKTGPSFALLMLAACAVSPAGEQEARDAAEAAGAAYATPFESRPLPAPGAGTTLAELLALAASRHGELEARWQEWRAALEEITQAGMQPTTAMLGVEHELDGGAALDRTALTLMSDAMDNLVWPGRLESKAAAALARAKVAARAFDAERLALQRRVAEAWHALAQGDAELALLERLRALLAIAVPSIDARVLGGAATQDEALRARAALERLDAERARLRETRPARLAALAALLATDTPLAALQPQLAELAPLRGEELALFAGLPAGNPALALRDEELAAAAAEIEARTWDRVPQFALGAMLRGDGVASLSGALTLPFLRGGAIEAAVRQAEAEHAAALVRRRQAGFDELAGLHAELAGLRALEAEYAILARDLLPSLRRLAELARTRWSAGMGPFTDAASAAADVIDVERALARLRAEHAAGRARLAERIGTLPG